MTFPCSDADRAAFETYLRDHAERLRDEGRRRFPTASGLRYERLTGEVVAQFEQLKRVAVKREEAKSAITSELGGNPLDHIDVVEQIADKLVEVVFT